MDSPTTPGTPAPKKKTSPRQEGRLAAVQYLYQLHTHAELPKDQAQSLSEFWELRPCKKYARAFAEELIRGVSQQLPQLDASIAPALENFRLERLNPVEQAILRLAVWELHHAPEPPPIPVVINEALELSHRLAGAESASFINGVLDQIAQENNGSSSKAKT